MIQNFAYIKQYIVPINVYFSVKVIWQWIGRELDNIKLHSFSTFIHTCFSILVPQSLLHLSFPWGSVFLLGVSYFWSCFADTFNYVRIIGFQTVLKLMKLQRTSLWRVLHNFWWILGKIWTAVWNSSSNKAAIHF